MAKKRSGLGKGLDQLLSKSNILDNSGDISVAEKKPVTDGLTQLAVDKLQRGKYQPRKDMDVGALEQLASSIRKQGILQPLVVRPISADRYEIIAGERRWRAAQMAGLDKVPTIIKDVSDQDTMAVALIENIQRENLNAIDEAAAIQRLIDECAMTHQQVADVLDKPRSSISNLLRLMSLAQDVKEFIRRGDLELGHGKVLLALEGASQSQAARTVVAKQLSVRETEQLVRKLQSPAKQLYPNKAQDPEMLRLQNNLSDKLSAEVKISHNAKGKGKLVIHYANLEELDNILEHID